MPVKIYYNCTLCKYIKVIYRYSSQTKSSVMSYHYGPRTLQTSSSTKADSIAKLYIVLMDMPVDFQTPEETLVSRVSEVDGIRTLTIDYSQDPPEILDGPFKTCLMQAYVHNGGIDSVIVEVPVANGTKKVPSGTINTSHSKQSEPRLGRMHAAEIHAVAGSGAGGVQDYQCRVHNILNNSNGRVDFFTVAADLPAGYSSIMSLGAIANGVATLSLRPQAGTSAQTAYFVGPKVQNGFTINRVHILGHENLEAEVSGEIDGAWDI